MANYTRQTWQDNDSAYPVSAARMNVIENGIYDAHFQPAARVRHTASQSIASGVETALGFGAEAFDTDAIHDVATANSRLTCKTAGIYGAFGHANFAANTTGTRYLAIRLNAAEKFAVQRTAAHAGDMIISVSTTLSLAVNDYIELVAWQDSGSALNITVVNYYSPEFGMVRVA